MVALSNSSIMQFDTNNAAPDSLPLLKPKMYTQAIVVVVVVDAVVLKPTNLVCPILVAKIDPCR